MGSIVRKRQSRKVVLRACKSKAAGKGGKARVDDGVGSGEARRSRSQSFPTFRALCKAAVTTRWKLGQSRG